ncbi:MAG TPA: hypothetical protein VMX75_12290 [Spirochaetia bacterium]|nr:hypothetical protein [Spirochaetia bacterium]
MNRNFRILYVFVVLVLILTGSQLLMAQSNAPLLLGINAKDTFPNGCVDCHKAAGSKVIDLVKKVSGHPDVAPIVKVVPKDCLMCHKQGGASVAFDLISHKSHYQNPKGNTFIANYQGSCLSCHSLDLASGKMSWKNGNKNW